VPVRVAFPGAARLDDGTLWLTTSRGIAVLSPRDMDNNQSSPVVRIESVHANDRAVSVVPDASLLPGTSTLRVVFTAPNLISPMQERFRYRLVGVDTQWIDAGVRREAFYANLRSGSYRFEVGRLTSDPAPDTSFAAWSFSIRPNFYETWWFTAVCLLLAIFLAWVAWQLRLRQLRQQFVLVFAERARMSREIHDTVVQELLGISLHFDELAASLGAASKPFEGQISRLKRFLEVAIVEAREVVWELRSPSVEQSTLPRMIREAGERAFVRQPVSVDFTLIGTPRHSDTVIERHLFRIAQEALWNASRYAEATQVAVALEYREETIRLDIRDNGRGLPFGDNEPENVGHYGFAIMRERAEQMSGRFSVESAPNRGTRIEVEVPTSPL
jgi:signal transduction histidine kinase